MVHFSLVEFESPAYMATLELRDMVLRKPLGLTLDITGLGNERESFHLAGYYGDRLCACLVLTPLDTEIIKMRQVAVHPDFQGKGIGEKLVRESEKIVKQLGYRHIVLNARKVVESFYKKLQYNSIGDVFEEVTIPHQKMEKYL